ncbi:hypothetical protein [Neisseria sp.]|uniref:hypothetical protein n=1 Tax=Neisseria sp. TaxID=192066 RepID=UPI002898E7CE|nr:hypothetical protein [Neisseria sp.]
MKKALFVLGFVLVLVGCSTTPTSLDTGIKAPDKYIYEKDLVSDTVDNSKGRVLILRDKGFVGSGCTFDIGLNGKKVFSLGQSQYLEVQLEPKFYLLSASIGGGLCPNLQMTQNMTLEAGEKQIYRIGWASNGQFMFVRTQ